MDAESRDRIPDEWHQLVSDGVLTAPALDLDGYQDCLRRCFAVGRDPYGPWGRKPLPA